MSLLFCPYSDENDCFLEQQRGQNERTDVIVVDDEITFVCMIVIA